MRILMLLGEEFPPDARVEKEINSLIATGHTVVLACFTRLGKARFETIRESFTVIRKPISTFTFKTSVGALKFPIYFNFWRRFASELLEEFTFDAVHVHDLPLAIVGYEISRKKSIPIILDLHENWADAMKVARHTNTFLGKMLNSYNGWMRYEKKYGQKADRIITVIEEMRQRIIDRGIDARKAVVVSNFLSIDSFTITDKEQPDPKHITLMYAGGITVDRGLHIVISGIALLKSKYPNLRLWIIGAGSYAPDLKKLALQKDVENQVEFLGWKNHAEISGLLNQSDYALIPHLKSIQTDCSSPNKIYQYMFAEKPILCTNCNSLERIIHESKSGIIYRHDSPDDFAEKLESLIEGKIKTDPAYAKNKIFEAYNWDAQEHVLQELYRGL